MDERVSHLHAIHLPALAGIALISEHAPRHFDGATNYPSLAVTSHRTSL